MSDEIKLRKSGFGILIALLCILFAVSMFLLFSSPYIAPFVFTVIFFVWGAYYAHSNRQKMSEMCCMMSGMTYGMISGFFIGIIVGLATADFLIGMIVGTVAGVLFGIPIGKLGGPLGRMEGVMAGPMGGIMGAMTGIMIRFYNVELFMPFIIIVVLFTVWEMTRVIHSQSGKISRNFIYAGIVLSFLMFGSVLANNFSADNLVTTGFVFGNSQNNNDGNKIIQPAPSDNGIQEVKIRAQSVDYNPNYVVVKKDIPVRLILEADRDAGCTRSFVMPAFKVRKTIPKGGQATVEFTPTKTGSFQFSCSMAMAGGNLIVQ